MILIVVGRDFEQVDPCGAAREVHPVAVDIQWSAQTLERQQAGCLDGLAAGVDAQPPAHGVGVEPHGGAVGLQDMHRRRHVGRHKRRIHILGDTGIVALRWHIYVAEGGVRRQIIY